MSETETEGESAEEEGEEEDNLDEFRDSVATPGVGSSVSK